MNVFWNVIRGGQTRIHNLRMFMQVAKKVVLISGVIYLGFISWYFLTKSGKGELKWAGEWLYSRAAVHMRFSPHSTTRVTIQRNGRAVRVAYTHRIILNDPFIRRCLANLQQTFVRGTKLGVGVVATFIGLVCWYLHRSGAKASSDRLIAGLEVVDEKVFKKLLYLRKKKEGSSGISLAGFTLPKLADATHSFIFGSAGSGKSVLCRELLTGMRKQERRAIIYDVSGEFVKNFYQPERDIILNPLDHRSACWDLWSDCKNPAQFHSLAEALIPEENNRKDFFITAARTVLADVAEHMSSLATPSLKDLLDLLLIADFNELLAAVKGTKSAAILNEEGGRTAASVRAVIAANIQALSYLPDSGASFSIRRWVKEESHPGGFIFITSNSEQLALLRPLITLWVNLATSAIMAMEPDQNRRIYLLLDELASLNRVPALHPFLAQGRKYGGCAVLCTQSYSQMVSLWGIQETKAIASGCSNWAVLRCNDIDSAEWFSGNLCRQEKIEKSQGVSYGAHEVRDSVSLSEQRRERPLVTPTELLRLPNLTGYLRLGLGLPLVRFESEYVNYARIAEPFVERSVLLMPSSTAAIDKGDEPEMIGDRTERVPLRLDDDHGVDAQKEDSPW